MMNRKIICFSLIALLLAAVGCRTEPTAIKGNVTGLADRMAYLDPFETGKPALDSAMMSDGKFSLRTKVKSPDLLFIRFAGEPNFHIPVVADGPGVSVTGDFLHPDEITVSGTPANDRLQQYRTSLYTYDIMIRSIALGLDEADTVGSDSLQVAAFRTKMDSIVYIKNVMRADYVRQNPECPVSAMLVYASLTGSETRGQIDSMINMLAPDAHNAFVDRLNAKRKVLTGK